MLRNRRHRILLAAGLIVLVLSGLLFTSFRALRPAAAYALVDESTLIVLSGQVQLARAGGSFANVNADTVVRVGDRIRTGADGYASLTYFDGSSTELEPGTEIEIRRIDRLPAGGQG